MNNKLTKKNLRIAYILKRYPRFSETFIVNEILALERQGVEIFIFALRPPAEGCFHENLSRVRAQVQYLPYGKQKAATFLATLKKAAEKDPETLDKLKSFLNQEAGELEQGLLIATQLRDLKIDILHAHFASMASSVARIASHFADIPYTLTAHAKDIFHETVNPEVLQQKLTDASAIITVSKHNVTYLTEKFISVAEKIKRIYNGLSMKEFPFRDSNPSEPRVLTVGRLVEKKGIDILLHAIAQLHKHRADVHCDIVGDGPLRPALETLAAQLNLKNTVHFHGMLPQHEVHSLMRNASVFAAPCVVSSDGDRDGLPTVLLEAMAIGVPCISTPVTGIPEVLHHHKTGLLVPEKDVEALADACLALLSDSNMGRCMAVAARELITQNFDIDINTQQLCQQWQALNIQEKVLA